LRLSLTQYIGIGDTFDTRVSLSLSAILLGWSIAIAIGDTFSAVSLSIILDSIANNPGIIYAEFVVIGGSLGLAPYNWM